MFGVGQCRIAKFRSCRSLVACDVSVVAGANFYGPDCSVYYVAVVLVMHSCKSHRCGLFFGVFSPVPGAGPFLSCTTLWSTLFGSGCSLRSTGTPDVSACCAETVTCLWLLQVVFDSRERVLRCERLLFLCRWTHLLCRRTQFWSRRPKPSCWRTQP